MQLDGYDGRYGVVYGGEGMMWWYDVYRLWLHMYTQTCDLRFDVTCDLMPLEGGITEFTTLQCTDYGKCW